MKSSALQPEGFVSVDTNGERTWKNAAGEKHRVGGPAVTRPDGYQAWFLNGDYHREDGPAIIKPNGTKLWLQHDIPHRLDGPWVEKPYDPESYVWCKNGFQHRTDGPADTTRHHVWYIEGNIVDVTWFHPDALPKDPDVRERVERCMQGERNVLFDNPELDCRHVDYSALEVEFHVVLLAHLKSWCTSELLDNPTERVRTMVAWQAPVDDLYLHFVLQDPHLRNVMLHREDLDSQVRDIMEVVT